MKKALSIVFLIVCIIICLSMYGKRWTTVDVVSDIVNYGTVNVGSLSQDKLYELADEIKADSELFDWVNVYEYNGELSVSICHDGIDEKNFGLFCEASAQSTSSFIKKYHYELYQLFAYENSDDGYLSWTSEDLVKGDVVDSHDSTKQSNVLMSITIDEIKSRSESGEYFSGD